MVVVAAIAGHSDGDSAGIGFQEGQYLVTVWGGGFEARDALPEPC
jgi:hypothetical protein